MAVDLDEEDRENLKRLIADAPVHHRGSNSIGGSLEDFKSEPPRQKSGGSAPESRSTSMGRGTHMSTRKELKRVDACRNILELRKYHLGLKSPAPRKAKADDEAVRPRWIEKSGDTSAESLASVSSTASRKGLMSKTEASRNLEQLRQLSPEEEGAIIRDLFSRKQMQVGENWYLVESRWWRNWKEYVNFDDKEKENKKKTKPGPINNQFLLDEWSKAAEIVEGEDTFAKLKKGLQKHEYQLVPRSVWKKLYAWYGGGPAIARKVVLRGFIDQTLYVELFPIHLRIMKVSNEEIRKYEFGSSATMKEEIFIIAIFLTAQQVRRYVACKWGIPLKLCRLFLVQMELTTPEMLSQTLEQIGIQDNQILLLRDSDNFLTLSAKHKGVSDIDLPSVACNTIGTPAVLGVVGLHNFGNTDFMNAALQCFSHTVPLTDYFVSEDYSGDVNIQNPRGSKGELVRKYAALMKEIWSGKFTSVAPRDFKASFTKLFPELGGQLQHDSMDFIEALLDCLHEDLKNEKARVKFHISKIYELFKGETSTKIQCSQCGHFEVQVEPFLSLSLDIPSKNERTIDVIFYRMEESPSKVLKYSVAVPIEGKIKDLRRALTRQTRCKNFALYFLCQEREWPLLDEDDLRGISKGDILHGYEKDAEGNMASFQPDLPVEPAPVHHRKSKEEVDDVVTIYDCIDRFNAEVPVSQKDKKCAFSRKKDEPILYYMLTITNYRQCDKCTNTEGTSHKSLHSPPTYLIIHLKRFLRMEMYQDKLSIRVKFPLKLDASNFRGNNNQTYFLYAVTKHIGDIHNGRYVALCKSKIDDNWYEFDDTAIRKISEEDVITGDNPENCYVLFYKMAAIKKSNKSMQNGSRSRSAPFIDPERDERRKKKLIEINAESGLEPTATNHSTAF